MVSRRFIAAFAGISVTVAGCASRPRTVATIPPPAPATQTAAMPAGAFDGMRIPARLSDGSFDTPNRELSEAATIWHLRAALNVAALACRGVNASAMVASYNMMLMQQKAPLAAAQTQLAAQYRTAGGDWQDRYDDAMTRLYNYFSQSFARVAFCTQANRVLADAATIAPADFTLFAAQRLPALDRPFVDFYRSYEAWQNGQRARPVIALQATADAPRRIPRLEVNMAALQDRAIADPTDHI